ncbi:MAG: sugar ABC transporter permease [Actinocatenispora sp.]
MTATATSHPPSRMSAPTRGTGGVRIRAWLRGPTPWLLPSMFVLILISLYPQLRALLNAFRLYNLSIAPDPLRYVGLRNFAYAFRDDQVLGALSHTLLFSVVTTAVELVLGFAIAVLLNQKLRGVRLARSLIILPTAIAPAVAGLAFRYFYQTDGIVPALLQGIGITPPETGILGDTHTALAGIMVTEVWQWTPFATLIFLAALQGVPQEVVEAARVDGASRWRTTVSVVLPLMRTVLVTVALLRFLATFNIFDIIYVQTQGGPGDATTTLGLTIFYDGLTYYNIGYASALTWLITLFIAVLISVYLATAGRKGRSL